MQKENITFDDFLKLDVRVCEIIEAEKVEGSNKLLKLKIKTGFDERVSVTNIGPQVDRIEYLVGLKLLFVLNLEPRKMMGIETKAMMVTNEDNYGKVNLKSIDAPVGSVFI